MIDPLTVERTGRPNDALFCPPGRCAASTELRPNDYHMLPDRLFELWIEVVESEPRTQITGRDNDELMMNAEQTSRVFRFVDTIAAKVLPVGDDSSTIAVYSRSNVGYWDLGVNQSRLENWLSALSRRVADNAD